MFRIRTYVFLLIVLGASHGICQGQTVKQSILLFPETTTTISSVPFPTIPAVPYDFATVQITLDAGDRVILSSTSDGSGQFAIDDGGSINGTVGVGTAGLIDDPLKFIGQSILNYFAPLEPTDVTRFISPKARCGGTFEVAVQLVDVGVVFGHTALFLVVFGSDPVETSLASSKIGFSSNRDGNSEIYLMNSDGSGQTRLTNNSANDFSALWSPDATRIAFTSNRDDPGFEIYVMNADATGQTRLTNDPALDLNPAWSPDGTKIAWGTNRDGNGEIYVMNADGSGKTNLTNNPDVDSNPAWSPDGSKIAFDSNRDGLSQIYVMNADGSGQTRLTNSAGFDRLPSWSPDGTKIVFRSTRDDGGGVSGNKEIYVMNADGTGQTRLTNDPAVDTSPVWSPDGTKIAFTSDRDGNFQVYVMNADGSGPMNISNNLATEGPSDWFLLSPEEQIEDLIALLQEIVDNNPGECADKGKDALQSAQSALDELNKVPPDNQAALGDIEGAVGDLEAAVKDELCSDVNQLIDIMDQLAGVARQLAQHAINQAIARGGDQDKIDLAQQALSNGDALRASCAFKDAVAEYKNAVAQAEGA